MNRYQYKEMIIEVVDEPSYKHDSVDNNFNYAKPYFGDDAEQYPTSANGIKLLRNSEIIDSCIIIGSGGATGIHQNSSLVDNDQLTICCCNTVFCLTLPKLQLKWKTQADQLTCFKLFELQNDYLVHGEFQITRLDKDGNIKWQFEGADIFVSLEGEVECTLADDHIMLSDFGNTKYKIDFDGKLFWDTYQRTEKIADNNTMPNTRRSWWQKLFGSE